MTGDVSQHQTPLPVDMSSLTSTVYDYDRSWLLILSGTVELNPGPMEREEMEELLASFGEKMMKRMDDISRDIKSDMKSIKTDINLMTGKLEKVENDVAALRSQMIEQEEQLDSIAEMQQHVEERLNVMEAKIEDQESRDRRDNVILHGVPELEGNGPDDCEERFLTTVNSVLPSPLRPSDIVRAHRLGRRVQGKTRPLIARMIKSSQKTAILQRRKDLRDKGYGVASDLTAKQREQIQQAKSRGLFAYFKGGVLHTEARRQGPTSSRPVTRSYASALGASSSHS